jgi:Cys-tRNA(Pro)/Cys-tRNA(Cys) deacylase
MTPAVQALERAKVAFTLHEYDGVAFGEGDYAVSVAAALGVDPARLHKSLVATVGGRLGLYVVPADRQLDLRSLGKGAAIADRAQAERATGYTAGGISPVGGRRRLPTTIDVSALEHETILVSAGRRGLQLELAPRDLVSVTDADVRQIVTASA